MLNLSFNCNFCNKAEIIVSESGILYCDSCKMSYGEVYPKVEWGGYIE